MSKPKVIITIRRNPVPWLHAGTNLIARHPELSNGQNLTLSHVEGECQMLAVGLERGLRHAFLLEVQASGYLVALQAVRDLAARRAAREGVEIEVIEVDRQGP